MAEANHVAYERRRAARRPQDLDGAGRPWRRRLARGGLALGVLLLAAVVAGIWRGAGRVHAVDGRVRAAVIAVSPPVGGRVDAVFVREGDRVEPGRELVRLDGESLAAELAVARAEVTAQQGRVDEAVAAQALMEERLRMEGADARTRVAVAEARVLESRAVRDRLQRGAREEDRERARVQRDAARVLLALRELEVRQTEELVAEGIDSEHFLEARRTQVAIQRAAVREAELTLARMEAGPREEDVRETAQVLAAREAEWARERERLAQTRTRDAERQAAEARVAAAVSELARAEAAVAGQEARLAALTLRSPVAGVVTRVRIRPGEMCRGGEPILWVADAGEPRWIEAWVRDRDAPRVRAGQDAWFRLPDAAGSTLAAVVQRVELHTAAMEHAVGGGEGIGPGERVGVILVPDVPVPELSVVGTQVRVVIRVR